MKQGVELSSRIDGNRGKKIKKVKIIVSEPWKAEAYNALAERKNIGAVMEDPAMGKVDKEKLSKFLSQFAKRINALSGLNTVSSEVLMKCFAESKEFMEKKLGSEIEFENETESKSTRASRALPDKPSIEIIWG